VANFREVKDEELQAELAAVRQSVMLNKDKHNALVLEMRVWLRSPQGILEAGKKRF